MGYATLAECVHDLERSGQLVRCSVPVDPRLEAGSIQRRLYRGEGPAILFTNVIGSPFPLLGNLYGTLARTRYIFRDTLRRLEQLVALKEDPALLLRQPLASLAAAASMRHARPRFVGNGPILAGTTTLDRLPQLISWPKDGGAFVTLPLVYSESPARPGWQQSNLGMYRVQISGNDYRANAQAGLHYQIHRGIGVHHAEAIERGEELRVNVVIGGAPALTIAAVMPLPEGMPELAFAGLLAGRRLNMVSRAGGLPIPAEADFCICGRVRPGMTLPEGPFGDHLGYYSLAHNFPVLEVEQVFHRPGAIFPFTTVGRPPQEDSTFGAFIHELTAPLIPSVLPGVVAVHAVDAAGVHPLLLAMGSERYVPYADEQYPMELLTQANAILGQGQLSLAKYLLIASRQDNPELDVHKVQDFLCHLLERVDWRRDLHFQSRTTIDTLDYSGNSLNQGSKVVIAAAGRVKRELPTDIPANLRLPAGFTNPRICLPGVLAVQGPSCADYRECQTTDMAGFCASFSLEDPINRWPLVVVVDDSDFVGRTLDNFLWTVFTRSNPAADIYGIGAFQRCKHWGCEGSLVIDARQKPHHAPNLEEDPTVERRIDELFVTGGPLHGFI